MKSAFFHKEPVQLADASEGEKLYGVMGECNLPVVFPLGVLSPDRDVHPLFRKGRPAICVVDDFYTNPEEIRKIALAQDFKEGPKNYKGKRTAERYLWAGMKEEFERLLGVHITDWLQQQANGVFQITGKDEPLVWHSDLQSYAAAIYLTPDAPPTAGTSFLTGAPSAASSADFAVGFSTGFSVGFSTGFSTGGDATGFSAGAADFSRAALAALNFSESDCGFSSAMAAGLDSMTGASASSGMAISCFYGV